MNEMLALVVLDNRRTIRNPILKTAALAARFQRFEPIAVSELPLRRSDRKEPQYMNVPICEIADFESRTKRVRAGDKHVLAERAGKPRLANRKGVTSRKRIGHMIVRSHRD